MTYVLAMDQGTTSSRAIVFDRSGGVCGAAQTEFEQILSRPGHVEHNPEDIWQTQLKTARDALKAAHCTASEIAAIGITNQRETTILWERDTGKPLANAIVWQSRVSAPICEQLKRDGAELAIREKTGLVVDAYFSGTKITHLLDTIDGARAAAERGEVLFGTVDCYLVWRLTGGRVHVTDASNASRTLLFNIHTLDWDDELLRLMNVPRAMLPRVVDSSGIMGQTDAQWLGGEIPIAGMAGDQQAATFGQACFTPGEVKNTYGTGCFMLMNIGDKSVVSQQQLLTTIGWQIKGRVTYCLEGSVFIAGAVVQWLRDQMGLIETSQQIEALAASVPDSDDVYFVPAFTGLGAPYWDANAAGLMIGLSRGTTAAHIARAAVDSMAYQSADLAMAMEKDTNMTLRQIKVDGGASVNNALMQFQSDLLNVTVHRPAVRETTALGAAYLAGLAVGYWASLDDVKTNWSLERTFESHMAPATRDAAMRRWRQAVERSKGWRQ